MLTRNPLDPEDDFEEFMRVKQIAKGVVNKHIPVYNFEKSLGVTNQGLRHKCVHDHTSANDTTDANDLIKHLQADEDDQDNDDDS